MADFLCVPNDVLDKVIYHGKKNSIHKAHDIRTGQSVAIKITTTSNDSLCREFSIMTKFSHPAVMKPHTLVSLDSGHSAMILPFAARGDLSQTVANFPLTEREGKSTFYRLATALQELHAASIWHRDIKLENIMVMSQNLENPDSVQLADFGFAKRFETTVCDNEFVGSLRYAAPEILKHVMYTEKVDIWSLGITLFAAMTQTFPYDLNQQRKDVLAGLPFLFCHTEIQRLSFPLKDLIRKMLELDPEKRLSAKEVANHRWFDDVRPSCELVDEIITGNTVLELIQN
jgi:serine/threonine protein kinase